MKFFFFLILEFFCEKLEILENENECDRDYPERTPMCPNEFGVCPLGSTFQKEPPINRTDICNYGPLTTEVRKTNGVNGNCVCDQPDNSKVPGYGNVFEYNFRWNGCLPYAKCCSKNNAELRIIEENGEKRYTCACKEGFEESKFRDQIAGVLILSCTKKCPENEEFTSCVANQVHCTPQPSPRICLHGCACKAGYKRAGKYCIKSEDCPVCVDGARYNNPPFCLKGSISLGQVYVAKKDKYGGLCQCGWSKVMIADGRCYDEEVICTKFGGVYFNGQTQLLKTPTKNCDGRAVQLMNGKCSCPSGYAVKEFLDRRTGLQTNKCIPTSQCQLQLKPPDDGEKQKTGKNRKSVIRI
ncbi:unnamed protein product [Oikopleura dioica]|uniref:EGF-like domain-containing protein n=1 Tax=Oikopleura dioica TaxID=34765 RepID=E4Y6Q2_OIKDI|nr:unnamed protein product [Oikopleura dioica]